VSLVEDTSRETASRLMRLNGLIDVLIPRGGKGLIHSVVEQATVPVIQTGDGYVTCTWTAHATWRWP
jgi:glutamate-5-semialdehyde dehydrogenase